MIEQSNADTPEGKALAHFMDVVGTFIAGELAHPNLNHGDAIRSLVLSLMVTDGVNSSDPDGKAWLESWAEVLRVGIEETTRCRMLIGRDGHPRDLEADGMKVKPVDVRRPS